MAIPDFDQTMRQMLILCRDKQKHSYKSIRDELAAHFALTPEDLRETISSGRGTRYRQRCGWSKTYLVKAGLLEYPEKGHMIITKNGLQLLENLPTKLDDAFLRKNYPLFLEFAQQSKTKKADTNDGVVSASESPEEALDYAFQQIQESLADEILAKVKSCSPEFFENLVVELLVAMGYGGSRADAGQKIGRSGDEGIDGIIKEDRLGLDVIYIQAKRWEGIVGRPEIQKFVGALAGKKAKKGVFITTSDFSKDAKDYADNLNEKVILIDGKLLARYMINFDVGVSKVETYMVKRLDSDYFSEE